MSLTNYDKLDAGVEKLSLDALEEIDHFLQDAVTRFTLSMEDVAFWQAFQREYSKVV